MRISDWSSDVCSSDLSGFRHYRKADHPQMGSDDVFAITSRGDDIWFGTYAGGLHPLAPDGSITHYGHDPDNPGSLPSDTVMSLVFDTTATLGIGPLAGLAKFPDGRNERVAMVGRAPPRLYTPQLTRKRELR